MVSHGFSSMINLFIDTNIYLTFYHYSSDDLEELKKLAVAIKSGEIRLCLTEQVKDEFKRNRESKIADALKRFGEQRLMDQFPQMCKEYEEYKELRAAIRRYEENKGRLSEKLRSDIEGKTLGADKVIADLFSKANVFEYSERVFASARLRVELGNPPGKSGSYGDAINWETLLKKLPQEDLYLITDDRDYESQITGNRLCEFLADEWAAKKKSRVFFYKKLSEFFTERFPKIKLASELEKELAISNLIHSGSFQATHVAIAQLSKFSDFTSTQINEIAEAAVTNTQIAWIHGDPDVRGFMQALVHSAEWMLEPEIADSFSRLYGQQSGEAEAAGEEDLPF